MKKELYYMMFLFLLMAFLPACNAQDAYRIEGHAEGFADGSKVSLIMAATHKDEKPTAETTITNGVFSFDGEVAGPRLYLLRIIEPSGCSGARTFMLENAEIQISVIKGKQLSGEYMEFAAFEVEGSASDKTFREKMTVRDRLNEIYEDNQRKHREIMDKVNAAQTKGEQDVVRKLMASEGYKAALKDDSLFFNTVEESMFSLFQENKDSFWGPLLVLANMSYVPTNDPRYMELYNSFSDEAKNSFYGQILKKQLFVKSLKGEHVFEFVLPDKDGKLWKQSELGKGKKLLLIDFWASWCSPCRKSIPTLKEIYKEFTEKGLEIVSISIDKDKEDWLKAVEEEQFPWFSLWDTQNVFSDKFNGKAVPTFILVDEKGVVLDDTVMIQNLRQKIESVL